MLGSALLAPGSAGAATFGTQEDIGGPTASPARVAATLDAAGRAGAKLFRVEANWSGLEPDAPGRRDPAELAALDRLVDAVSARGMKTVLFINRTPCWASSAPAGVRNGCDRGDVNRPAVWRYRPTSPRSVVPVSTFLIARYAKRLAAFQIWNEPDQANEKYWAGDDKVRSYVAMTRALYKPLKRAAPKVPVLAGSFVGSNGRWLSAMYAAGAKGNYDGLAVQFYSRTLFALRNTRAIQRANGDRKPLWLTEYGFSGCLRPGGPALQIDQPCVSGAAQVQGTVDILAALKRRSWVKAAIQYDVFDDGPGGYTFGLFTSVGKAKPLVQAIRRVLSGRVRLPRAPTVRLRQSGGRLTIAGTASITELLTVRVSRGGVLRYRATLVTDPRGRWSLRLPAVLGASGLTVSASAGWTGSVSRRS